MIFFCLSRAKLVLVSIKAFPIRPQMFVHKFFCVKLSISFIDGFLSLSSEIFLITKLLIERFKICRYESEHNRCNQRQNVLTNRRTISDFYFSMQNFYANKKREKKKKK